MSPEVAARFPASIYAAHWDFQLLDLSASDPARVRGLIERNQFLSWNSVPDVSAPGFQKPLVGTELGRWRISRGTQILRDHPNFPYAEWIRLAIAVNQFALGDRKTSLEQLNKTAHAGNKNVSEWAARFLAARKN